jgi:hypothetical protein
MSAPGSEGGRRGVNGTSTRGGRRRGRRSFSTSSHGAEEKTTIHFEHLAADPACIVGCKERDGVGDIGGLPVPAERSHVGDILLGLCVVRQPSVHVGRRDAR